MLRVGIIGVGGYAGEALLDILLKHREVKITYLTSKIEKKQNINEIFPRLKGKLDLECDNIFDKQKSVKLCELLFLALPHTVSMQYVPTLLEEERKVIDLSADYRLRSLGLYEQYYKIKHSDRVNLKKAVYGLPEVYRTKIKTAQLIANPGCYPTAAILALAPLLKNNLIEPDSIIIDAKSGFSGAGRDAVTAAKKGMLNNFKAYKVNIHQHMPEINQEFSLLYGKRTVIMFVPHILPIERGILATIYVKKIKNLKSKIKNPVGFYKKFYKKEQFVRILAQGQFPEIKDVAQTNFCDIGIKEMEDELIIICAIDNLLKGASGQAVQNMNIMYSFPEDSGLQ